MQVFSLKSFIQNMFLCNIKKSKDLKKIDNAILVIHRFTNICRWRSGGTRGPRALSILVKCSISASSESSRVYCQQTLHDQLSEKGISEPNLQPYSL